MVNKILCVVPVLALLTLSLSKFGTFADDVPSELMGEDRQTMNKDSVEKIKLGDSYNDVLTVLGRPDYDDRMYPKMGGDAVGRRLLYIVEQFNPELFNEKKDSYLRLWFDPNDSLLDIDPHNIP